MMDTRAVSIVTRAAASLVKTDRKTIVRKGGRQSIKPFRFVGRCVVDGVVTDVRKHATIKCMRSRGAFAVEADPIIRFTSKQSACGAALRGELLLDAAIQLAHPQTR